MRGVEIYGEDWCSAHANFALQNALHHANACLRHDGGALAPRPVAPSFRGGGLVPVCGWRFP